MKWTAMTLPNGFDAGLWIGWEPCDCNKGTNKPQCGFIMRDCADYSDSNPDHSLRVEFIPGRVVHSYMVVNEEGFGDQKHFDSQQSAHAFCEKYAAEHGGWMEAKAREGDKTI